jgi:hypothetical protein
MAQELDRDLRRLAKRYRIRFKPPGLPDQWPAAHRTTFENIRAIGEQKLDSFCASIDIHFNDQPWRKQTKNRAEWLAKRATQLFNQQRNEAGWRFGLENDVLQRFGFEVAWLDLLKHFKHLLMINVVQIVEQGFGDQKSKLISKNPALRHPS